MPSSLSVAIHQCKSLERPGWLALRETLWPHCSREQHLSEMAVQLADPSRYAHFLASSSDVTLGLAEAAIRSDYVNGTATSPVGFLKGIYVVPEARRQGIARALLAAVIAWARETERVVFFVKAIG